MSAVAASADATPKIDQSDDERTAAPVAVAERAGREEQRGQGERVGVDDPLLLRLAGVEIDGDSTGRPLASIDTPGSVRRDLCASMIVDSAPRRRQ